MKLILSSAGLENEVLKSQFLMLLDKDVKDVHPLFIPTAAIDPGAIAVLPKCMNDLLKCGIPEENITVFDLHKGMCLPELEQFDLVYLCGGRTSYLLQRINDTGFRDSLLEYIQLDGLVLESAPEASFLQIIWKTIWAFWMPSWMSTARAVKSRAPLRQSPISI